jgi:hypothetical protein
MKQKRILLVILLITTVSISLFSQTGEFLTTIDTMPDNSAIVSIERTDGKFYFQYMKMEPPYEIDFSGHGSMSGKSGSINNSILGNIDLPNDFGGSLPRDVCYNPSNDKYYVYSPRKVIVIDGDNKDKEAEINISEIDIYSQVLVNLNPENRIAINNDILNPYLYCATEGGKLAIINYNTQTLITTLSITTQELGTIVKSSVLFDQNTQNLFWFVSSSSGDNIIATVYGTTISNSETWGEAINDMVLSDNGNYIYVSIGNRLIEYNSSLTSYSVLIGNLSNYLGAITYGNDIVYCHEITTSNIKAYNTNTGLSNTITTGFTNIFRKVYDPVNDKVYYTGSTGSSNFGLRFINGATGLENQTFFEMDKAIGLEYSSYNNPRVYFGGKNKLAYVDCATDDITEITATDKSVCYQIETEGNLGDILSVQPLSGNVLAMGHDLVLEEKINIGGVVKGGCVIKNQSINKAFFALSKGNYESYVAIIDLETNSFEELILVPYNFEIEDIQSYQQNGLIFLNGLLLDPSSDGGDIRRIIEIDFNNNFAFSLLDLNSNNNDKPFKLMIVTENGKIFTGGKKETGVETCYILDINNNYNLTEIIINDPTLCYSRFQYFENGTDKIVALVSTCSKIVYFFDAENNTLLNSIPSVSGTIIPQNIVLDKKNQFYWISYNDDEIKAYHYGTLTEVENYSWTSTSSKKIDGLFYNEYQNEIYGVNGNQVLILKENEAGDFQEDEINLGNTEVIESYYNNINDQLYLYLANKTSNDLQIVTMDCSTDEIGQELPLDLSFQYFNPPSTSQYHDIVHNTASYVLYFCNYSMSTISVVNAGTDKLDLNSGWNWLSFPRLERYENNPALAIPFLERINYFPAMELYLEENSPDYIEYNPIIGWLGDLQNFKSTTGYKMDLDVVIDGETPKIELQGAIVDEETEMNIYPNQENWMGYFITYPQTPFDCFDAATWNNLTEIKTQYWTMIKKENAWWIKGKVTPFVYGDMVILKTEAYQTFQWVNSGSEAESAEIPKTTFYSYEEQADYLPIYVEFDATSDVKEVAVTLDGEVKGAAVRDEGETIVEVNAYLEGAPPDATLEFDTWDGYKAAPVKKDGYIVYNRKTKLKEKRSIYVGENTNYQLVSFKEGEVYETPAQLSEVSCLPNPFSNEATITFRINETMVVWVEILDLNGRLVKTLMSGEIPGGVYSTTWEGDNDKGSLVKKGVYFYKVRTSGGSVYSDKVVLIK